jgi:hypothetical protein
MIIDNKFHLGQIVYLITDKEQFERVVVGICQRPAGIIYYLACNTNEFSHFECEVSSEKNVLLTINK